MLMEDYGDTIIGNKPMAPVPIVALAHEFFDALPVHWFQYDGVTGWGERTVVEERGAFRFHVSKTENIEKILKPSVRFSKEVTIKDGDMIEVNA
jgi:SAM-dependent MidA family methyltransferase